MNIWAVVPIKPIHAAKSRLASVLSPRQRSELALNLLQNTLSILSGWKSLAGTLVASADPAVWEVATQYRVEIFKEPDVPGLNESLRRAAAEIDRLGAEAVLVVPGDLPFLDRSSLQKMIDLAQKPPLMVISPDKKKQGTNAMLVAPTGAIPFRYGPDSFRKHQDAARLAHIPTYALDLPSLAIDIDLPEDLLSIQQWRK
jgi:2-phospho-L-lactate/phosphoenolpyruvate guanylyltransferase